MTDQIDATSFDAPLPAEVATKAERAGVAKANLPAAGSNVASVICSYHWGLGR